VKPRVPNHHLEDKHSDFRLKAGNGLIFLISAGYGTSTARENDIASVKETAVLNECHEQNQPAQGKVRRTHPHINTLLGQSQRRE
jgi:uncharacterized protein YegP (UPF0339 family)